MIDELDRADEEFESFLLELLSDFQITISEIGTLRARHKPKATPTKSVLCSDRLLISARNLVE